MQRISSIEDAENAILAAETFAERSHLRNMVMMSNYTLLEALEAMCKEAMIAIEDKKKLLTAEYMLSTSNYRRYKWYTWMMCYEPDLADIDENVCFFLYKNYNDYIDATPNFAMIREFYRSYYKRSVFSDKPLKYLLCEAPPLILSTLGWRALNTFLSSFIRPSVEEQGKYSFSVKPNNLRKDVRTITTANKLLNKSSVIPHEPVNPSRIIEEISEKIIGTDTKLKVAESDEEFARVYVNGPRSCMDKEALFFETEEQGRMHVTALYNTDDIGLVYGERGGTITGRAIFNKATNEYVRAYGDSYFTRALHEAGYRENAYALNGLCMKLRHLEGFPNIVLTPYVDGNAVYARIEDNALRLSDSCQDFTARTQWGLYDQYKDRLLSEYENPNNENEPENPICPYCEGYYDEEDGREVFGEDEDWCFDCYDMHTVEAIVDVSRSGRRAVHERVWDGNEDLIDLPNGEIALNSLVADELGYVEDVNGDWQHEDDVYEYEGDYYTREQLEGDGLTINDDGEVCKDGDENDDDAKISAGERTEDASAGDEAATSSGSEGDIDEAQSEAA